jgi:hypothetical protein
VLFLDCLRAARARLWFSRLRSLRSKRRRNRELSAWSRQRAEVSDLAFGPLGWAHRSPHARRASSIMTSQIRITKIKFGVFPAFAEFLTARSEPASWGRLIAADHANLVDAACGDSQRTSVVITSIELQSHCRSPGLGFAHKIPLSHLIYVQTGESMCNVGSGRLPVSALEKVSGRTDPNQSGHRTVTRARRMSRPS